MIESQYQCLLFVKMVQISFVQKHTQTMLTNENNFPGWCNICFYLFLPQQIIDNRISISNNSNTNMDAFCLLLLFGFRFCWMYKLFSHRIPINERATKTEEKQNHRTTKSISFSLQLILVSHTIHFINLHIVRTERFKIFYGLFLGVVFLLLKVKNPYKISFQKISSFFGEQAEASKQQNIYSLIIHCAETSKCVFSMWALLSLK